MLDIIKAAKGEVSILLLRFHEHLVPRPPRHLGDGFNPSLEIHVIVSPLLTETEPPFVSILLLRFIKLLAWTPPL